VQRIELGTVKQESCAVQYPCHLSQRVEESQASHRSSRQGATRLLKNQEQTKPWPWLNPSAEHNDTFYFEPDLQWHYAPRQSLFLSVTCWCLHPSCPSPRSVIHSLVTRSLREPLTAWMSFSKNAVPWRVHITA